MNSYVFIARRKKMVDELFQKGIRSSLVLKAMSEVPREKFMSSALVELSYDDKAYPIGSGQTISQPFTVANQTELLNLTGAEKVLEVGTGSGYQSAVLLQCGCKVFSIERQKKLFIETKQKFDQLGLAINCCFGDGFEGWESEAPFDRILITAGANEIPQKLLKQLAVGGYMVLPYGEINNLRMIRIFRKSATEYESEDFGSCSFVPMLKGVVS